MHKIIHSNFQFDLSPYKLTIVEENQWFIDQFFTSYSFPFDFELTEELKNEFGDYLDDNAFFIKKKYKVKYVNGNKIYDAIFYIENQEGDLLSASFKYGFYEISTWNKRISELNLEIVSNINIYTHANTIINQTWPAVNYNFPQIHTNKYNIKETVWSSFLGIINNYRSGAFIQNTASSTYVVNSNFMQALPYLLYVLKQGFSEAGYVLSGDILNNSLLKKVCLFADVDNFIIEKDVNIDINISKDNFNNFVDVPIIGTGGSYTMFFYTSEFELKTNSKYRIKGTGKYNQHPNPSGFHASLKIDYKTSSIFSRESSSSENGEYTFEIDELFTTDATTDASQKLTFDINTIHPIDIVFTGVLTKVLDNDEPAPPELEVEHIVDLNKVVPNITFGKLFTEMANLFNFQIDSVIGNTVTVNFINDKINRNDFVDLSEKEIKKRKRTFYSDKSFLLKYNEVDSEEFKYDVVFKNITQEVNNEHSVNDDTESIEIDALPLPLKDYFGSNSAFSFDNGGADKLYLVLYSGLNQDQLNFSEDSGPLLIPNIYNSFHKNWISFKIHSIPYNWIFKAPGEFLQSIGKKIFAYKKHHIIKSIEKTEVSPDIYEVEIETETLD